MSGETPLVAKIEGYTVVVFKNGHKDNPITELDLRLNKVGGAHIENPDDLIMMLEDAVFNEEGL